jgi:hypothetical protein
MVGPAAALNSGNELAGPLRRSTPADSITRLDDVTFVSFFCDRVPDFSSGVSVFPDEEIACDPRFAWRKNRFVPPDKIGPNR